MVKRSVKKNQMWEAPGCTVVRTPGFHCSGSESIPGWGTEIPQAVQDVAKKKRHKRTKFERLIVLVSRPNINLQYSE